ncbi:C-C motif chemokine 20-like [Carassius auratus]|uniref:C-C motif chemokine n=1 Tax=Carassius auratus TaxID=7957 RepID=A0A6P6PKG2_CARAU|nr:C-C motif chemokine 20-like [Carassius auratus]XP_052452333.1 C-C motif chemokine 20b [Carassius gibelio]
MAHLKTCTLSVLILIAFLMETDAGHCCLKYRRRPLDCRHLKGFDIQKMTGRCDLAAIIFHTKNGKFVCADPKQPWTQDRVECLRMKAAVVKTGGGF